MLATRASSEGERDHNGDYRIGPVLVALRDMLRAHGTQIPNVQFVVDLDDKTFESQLPIMAFAAIHPRAALKSSVLLVPDWTHMPRHKMREWQGWTYDHSTVKWAGSEWHPAPSKLYFTAGCCLIIEVILVPLIARRHPVL